MLNNIFNRNYYIFSNIHDKYWDQVQVGIWFIEMYHEKCQCRLLMDWSNTLS